MKSLSVRSICRSFGGVRALEDVSFDVGGEIVGLIGPNGSGKTTCVNLISALYVPDRGGVFLDGRSLVGLPPHAIVRSGIGRTFQNLRLLKELSVLDNVKIGQSARIDGLRTWTGLAAAHVERRLEDDAFALLDEVGLRHRASDPAGKLPYGQQKRLEVARALATRPDFLLLDEPAGGMNAEDMDLLKALMRRLRDRGTGLLLIEHNMSFVMDTCDRVVVLNFGRKLAEGRPEEIQANRAVIDAYLGEAA